MTGGMFCLPPLGIRFIPTDFTVVVFPARNVFHGTTPMTGYDTATLYGSSHFLKVSSTDRLAAFTRGCAIMGVDAKQYQAKVIADLQKAKTASEKKAIEEKAADLRLKCIREGQAAGVQGCVLAANRNGFTRWKAMVNGSVRMTDVVVNESDEATEEGELLQKKKKIKKNAKQKE